MAYLSALWTKFLSPSSKNDGWKQTSQTTTTSSPLSHRRGAPSTTSKASSSQAYAIVKRQRGRFQNERREDRVDTKSSSTNIDTSDRPKPELDLDGTTLFVNPDAEISKVNDKGQFAKGSIADEYEFTDRFISIDDARFRDWSTDEIWMFNKLSRRGYEPLLPEEWQWDFPSFPDSLFSAHDDLLLIKNLKTCIVDATNELDQLVQTGPRCRDALLLDQRPESRLRKGIKRYIKWSIRDAGLHRKQHLPVIGLVCSAVSESVDEIVETMTEQLHALACKWRSKLQNTQASTRNIKVPTLYGFVIKYSIVAIVTYDMQSSDGPIRTLVTLDFQQLGQDVWHALAIAIVCIKARNFLLQLHESDVLGDDISDSSDPDA